MSGADLLDVTTFSAIERMGAANGFASKLLTTYETRSSELVGQILALAGQGDAPALRVAAHSLKGASASIGARAVSQVASAIEVAAKNGACDTSNAARLDGLVRDTLVAMRARLPAG